MEWTSLYVIAMIDDNDIIRIWSKKSYQVASCRGGLAIRI
jgi:hypothetical protein